MTSDKPEVAPKGLERAQKAAYNILQENLKNFYLKVSPLD